jgi:arylsulfatase A-like enzyme
MNISYLKKAVLCSCTLLAVVSISAADTAKKPNIIYIMTDDLGIGKVESYGLGNGIVKTPNITKLAAEGMRFTDAYSANAVCGPSRASLLSGRHPGNCGIRKNIGKEFTIPFEVWPTDAPRLGNVMQAAGYKTACVGKIGAVSMFNTNEMNSGGWDYWNGFLHHNNAYFFYPPFVWENGKKVELPANLDPELMGKFYQKGTEQKIVEGMPDDYWKLLVSNRVRREIGEGKGTYIEDYFADRVIDFMRDHADEPFFIYFPTTAPHGGNPGLSVPRIYDVYRNDSGLNIDEQVYASCITRHDANVGRIMDELKKLGLDDNTLVIWSADNGDQASYYRYTSTFNGNGPYRECKLALYEGGLRVPAIARWPKEIKPGLVSDFVWAAWDLMPTFADLAGYKPTHVMDGISIAPTLMGKPEQQTKREYLYWEIHQRCHMARDGFTRKKERSGKFQQSVRMGKWKGYRGFDPGTGAIELYDLENDPGEFHNLAEKYPEIVQKIERVMQDEHTPHPTSKVAVDK